MKHLLKRAVVAEKFCSFAPFSAVLLLRQAAATKHVDLVICRDELARYGAQRFRTGVQADSVFSVTGRLYEK